MAEPPFEITFHKLRPCSIQSAKVSFPNPSTTAGALHKQLPSLKGAVSQNSAKLGNCKMPVKLR